MSFPKIRLDQVCRITMGQAPSGDSYNFDGNGLALIAGAGDFGKETPEPKKYTTAAGKKSEIGEIILCIRATIGDLNWSDKEYCLGRGVAGLFGHKDKLDQKYLWHWLKNVAPLLKSKGKGATFLQVTKEDICSLEIALPPLSEQRRIASILDQADELRQKRQQSIEKLDQLLQATFIDMFGDPVSNPKGWDVGRIGDMLESVKYGSSDKATLEGEIPILRMNNLTYSGEMDLTDLKYITKVQADEKYLVKEGDILFNRTNSKELVGKTAVYVGPEPMAYAGYLVRGRTKANYAPEYISAFLNSPWGKEKLQSMCKSIVGMANINAKEFQSIVLPIPPENEQIQFKNKVLTIREKKRLLINQLSILETLFKSLQNKAFSGTL
ncbi:restriction endonuclease subunit S [Acinetobacter pittii]|uniref:restriction endonuclease subunit S n=1 Tax=Acinetobacter pittii TaxID=48296 RepID=UPI0024690416|nr:restriction endonuclease subunit S [Acinetobacter pittii]WGM23915.1 restriction endonuclease subunit S [Acinetobacter pittii]